MTVPIQWTIFRLYWSCSILNRVHCISHCLKLHALKRKLRLARLFSARIHLLVVLILTELAGRLLSEFLAPVEYDDMYPRSLASFSSWACWRRNATCAAITLCLSAISVHLAQTQSLHLAIPTEFYDFCENLNRQIAHRSIPMLTFEFQPWNLHGDVFKKI